MLWRLSSITAHLCESVFRFIVQHFLVPVFIMLFFPVGATGTPVYDIDNNLCRLVDVRGDTTVDFTIP